MLLEFEQGMVKGRRRENKSENERQETPKAKKGERRAKPQKRKRRKGRRRSRRREEGKSDEEGLPFLNDLSPHLEHSNDFSMTKLKFLLVGSSINTRSIEGWSRIEEGGREGGREEGMAEGGIGDTRVEEEEEMSKKVERRRRNG